MSYFILEDFRLGQDSRKDPLTAAPGTLTTLINAHITRGGELEKRKSFVSTYTLPTGTFGLASAGGGLYVFGSATDPGVPSGVTYQRLTHPTSEAMTAVLHTELFNGLLYVVAEFADDSIYHFYNGTRIDAFADGRARGGFTVTAGTHSAGTNKVSSILVNGVEILNVAVDWVTSHTTTAANIAAQINTYASTPEYTATSSGARVIIIAGAGTGTTPNDFTVAVTVGGDVTVGSVSAFSGGADDTLAPGVPVQTLGTKMYTVSGSNLVFSAVDDPTDYNDETGIGAGIINMANHAAGSEDLTDLAVFYDKLAIFAKEAVQIWFVEADDANNTQAQVIQSTGTAASRSAVPFGDGDVFYLAPNGVRALKARDTNNIGTVSEVGTAIDTDLVAYLATLTTEQQEQAVSIVEPLDNRFWLSVGSRIYVYSFFAGSKIAAWSTYEVGVDITEFAILNKRVYARADDTIYLYGGVANDTYDDSEVEVRVPYIDAQSPAHPKTLSAIDLVSQGSWTVQMASNPDRGDDFDDIGTFSGSTLHKQTMPAEGCSPYFSFKFVNNKAEYARLSRFVMHFDKDEAKAA